jgi:hypothetical protein
MSAVAVTVGIDNLQPAYFPGQMLAGRYRLTYDEPPVVQAIELSVLWHTEGKGDEDLGVHFFDRLLPAEGDSLDPSAVRRFQTRLPHSPLSYLGQLLSILWSVRVRVLLAGGGEVVGHVASGAAVASATPQRLSSR